MAIFGWIIRILTVLIAVRLILRLINSLRTGSGTTGRPAQNKQTGPRPGGRLVRDPQCGTHIPEGKALRLGTGDKTQYFCSTECRDQWQATRRAG
jgi:YHS domain-containing protein